MLKSFTALLLLIAVLTTNFSRCFIYAGFELNRKYIASSLCENIDKPLLNCKGKCYLAKKIKQAEEKEKNQEQQSQKNRFQEALIAQRLKINPPSGFDITTAYCELDFNLPKRSSAVFHPPKV